MGRGTRNTPNKLGKKLAQVRSHLGLSQDGLVRALALSAKLTRNDISKYERGVREPSLSTLLKYARVAGVTVEVLIDDDLEIPVGSGRKTKRRAQL
jgi:transcriptional regulator with XRE-family HTH domain